jgi:L-lactate dehydrogenase
MNMFENLFTANPSAESKVSIRPRKGVIIGAGQVGMACAYSMMIQNCFDELIIQDIQTEKLQGEVMDLTHGLPFVEPVEIKAGTVADVGQNADMVIITAGASQKIGESRLDLVLRNVAIYKSLIADVVKYCPDAILLIVSNPVDIMTYATLKLSGFPAARVIGTGTVLDSARFRTLLAQEMGIDVRSVHAYIIGEHGDSEVPVWSKVNISGMSLCDQENNGLQEIFDRVKNAGYEILKLKGYTSYAIGLATTEIVKAILHGQDRILTVSSLVNDFYGISDVCLSLPSVVNQKGVIKRVNITLSDKEQQQLIHSAKVLHDIFDTLTL